MKNYIKSIQGKDKNMSLDMKNKRNLAILFVLMLPFSWVNFSFGSVYRIITFAIFALFLVDNKGIIVIKADKKSLFFTWITYCLYTIITFLWSGMEEISKNTMLGMCILLAISIIFFTTEIREERKKLMDLAWILGGCVFIILFFTGKTASVGFGSRQTLLILGTWTDPNEFASYFVVAIPLALYSLFEYKNKIIKILSAFTVIGGIYVVLMSGSRGALISMLISVSISFLISMKDSPKRIFLFVVILIIGYYIFMNYLLPLIPAETFKRLSIEALAADNGSGRSQIWERGLKQFQSGNAFNILFGYGYGGLMVDTGLSYITATTTMHNQFLQQIVCYGIIGFCLYIRLFFYVIRDFIKNKKELIGPFVGIIVMGMTITMGPSYKILWILLFHAGLQYKGELINEKY